MISLERRLLHREVRDRERGEQPADDDCHLVAGNAVDGLPVGVGDDRAEAGEFGLRHRLAEPDHHPLVGPDLAGERPQIAVVDEPSLVDDDHPGQSAITSSM